MLVDFLIWSHQTFARAGGGGVSTFEKKIYRLGGPYREIFPSVLKTSLGPRPRAVFDTSGNISLQGPSNQ